MKKENPWALLPIAVFLAVFIGCGILFEDFYAMPAIVGFLIALVVAFRQDDGLFLGLRAREHRVEECAHEPSFLSCLQSVLSFYGNPRLKAPSR